ncbi:MAG TPA: Re/Si-specific NAD(P)(+) transhydrogenase subunit alpha [Gammaproteobacteria bacterium]|nr:Re/Si-specific NAD(P)(+) transhydrogenase subunit alpha [Gammaproteobacteria bacterium]
MSVTVGVPKETAQREKRVAMVPVVAERLEKLGVELLVQAGAGEGSRIPDSAFENATVVNNAQDIYKKADIVLKVQPPSVDEIKQMRQGAILASFVHAHREPEVTAALRDGKITSFAMELVPRITRAQSIDALSSQASAAGYKAALIAANSLERFFPMLTTAAGTIRPAKVLVIGAGVAGLQAIATAKRLGAQVEAYDVRSATREQVESLGAKFVQTDVKAEGEGGYARELTDEEKQAQQDMLAKHIAKSDAVITTAAVPGRPSPKIVSKAMVEGMKSGAVLVDLAAEGGGNCELTKPGEDVRHGEVTIVGPLNIPSMLSEHASEMYARNLLNLLTLFVEEGELKLNWEDEVIAKTALTHDGEIRNEAAREAVESGSGKASTTSKGGSASAGSSAKEKSTSAKADNKDEQKAASGKDQDKSTDKSKGDGK